VNPGWYVPVLRRMPTNGVERRRGVRRGIPVIEGTRIATREIMQAFLKGQSIDAIAAQTAVTFPAVDIPRLLTNEEVEAAIRFECCRTCKGDRYAWARDLPLE